jgi:GntR family transcriptional regulator
MISHSGIVLSRAGGRPMYLQIMEQIRQRIAVGDWPAAQPLPSIRQLATDLGVSVITIKRAYLELEREGVTSRSTAKAPWSRTVSMSARAFTNRTSRNISDRWCGSAPCSA